MAVEEQDVIKKPPQVAPLKGKFTPAAKQRIEEFLASFHSFEPTLAFLYGDMDGKVAGRPSWSIAAFGERTADDMIEKYASFGAVVCYELDGLRVLVPQMSRLSELDGGTLDFVGNRLCAAPPSAG